MATAKLILDEVGGWPGRARCYHVDPPANIMGGDHDHVVVWVQPRYGHQSPEVGVLPSTEFGAAKANSVMRQAGSFTLHNDFDPADTTYVDGVCWLALQLLGGYQPAPAEEPESGEGGES